MPLIRFNNLDRIDRTHAQATCIVAWQANNKNKWWANDPVVQPPKAEANAASGQAKPWDAFRPKTGFFDDLPEATPTTRGIGCDGPMYHVDFIEAARLVADQKSDARAKVLQSSLMWILLTAVAATTSWSAFYALGWIVAGFARDQSS